MTLEANVGETVILHILPFEVDGETPYSGLIDTDFTKRLFRDGAVSGVTPTVSEIGSTGTYQYEFVPDGAGFWWAEAKVNSTSDWFKEPVRVRSGESGGEVSEAQANVAYNEDTGVLYIEVWLDRDGQSVSQANLTSCEVDCYDIAGTLLFTETSSSPKVDGRFSLSNTIGLNKDTVYNMTVTVTDDVGDVVTFQTFTTAG